MHETEMVEAEVIEALPLPADLEAYEANLEAFDEAGAPTTLVPLALPTLADVQRALARVRHFRRQAAEVSAVYDAEEQRLVADLTAVRQGRIDATRPWERRELWYMNALEQFVRAQHLADPKIKTLKLPAGDLTLRAQQPEWNYGDEDALAQWLHRNAPECVRPRVDKTELKKFVKVRPDGSVVYDSGELIPGITVAERPPKFDLKVAL